jgi:uncharacterized protein YbjT (DUF2867 family)
LEFVPLAAQDASMIVITTPTGDIGSQVLRGLLERAPAGEALRVVVRDPARLPADVRDRVEVVVGSHGDPDVADRAVAGADAVFWLVPPDPRAASLDAAYTGFARPAAAAFRAPGGGRGGGISALGRGTAEAGRAGYVTASLAMDDLIAQSGAAYRALACPSFMDNVLRQTASIRDRGVYVGTGTPDRPAPTAATRDIAAVAVDLLLDRSWGGVGSVPVLGPEDLTPEDLVRTMSEVLGTPVRYEQQPFDDFGATMAGYGMSDATVAGMVDMMRAKDAGLDDGVDRATAADAPTTFRRWCEEVLLPAVRA